MSSQINFRIVLKDVLIIGLHVIKRLETLHKCGFALNNLCLDNLSYSPDKKKLFFCDLRMATSFEAEIK